MVSLKSAKTFTIDLMGQGFTTGFDVMNSNLVLTAEQNVATRNILQKHPSSVGFYLC